MKDEFLNIPTIVFENYILNPITPGSSNNNL